MLSLQYTQKMNLADGYPELFFNRRQRPDRLHALIHQSGSGQIPQKPANVNSDILQVHMHFVEHFAPRFRRKTIKYVKLLLTNKI